MNLKRYTSAGGVIVHDGQMLLLDRPSRGEVRLPKGHVEHDEAPEEAALREVAEEAGYPDLAIVADLGWKAVTFEYEGDRIVRDERYFLMHLTSRRQIRRSKKDEKQFQPIWVPMDAGPDELTYASEQSVARAALAIERGEGDAPHP